ncbi:MAG: hypothetical protein PHO20_01805 [Candidatus Peribacteraceae bacterium]|nr:hypothetical protein [Candidatus Peribacteraceae bacterium]MDD5739480.1 hypothetical protein [Candidatus Peribacteraceae bacterium]
MKRGMTVSAFAVFVALVFFVLFRGAGYNPFFGFPVWKAEGTVVSGEQDTNQNPDIIPLRDGCYRLYAHGAPAGDGKMSIYSHRSCDGLYWQFEGKRIDMAAMPAVLPMSDGKVMLYFQRGMGNGAQAFMVATSDDGLHFTVHATPLLVTGKGELKTIRTMSHFELVQLDKGYRMYFDEGGLTPVDFERYAQEHWAWPVSRIRSLYSEDGMHWSLEAGVRIEYEQEPLRYMQRAESCTVFKEDGIYHMYFGAGFSPWEDLKSWKRWSWSGIYEAVSNDGLEWHITDRAIFHRGSDPKIIRVGDVMRLYLSEGDRIGGNAIESYVRQE